VLILVIGFFHETRSYQMEGLEPRTNQTEGNRPMRDRRARRKGLRDPCHV
jgi:hypothetical protein